MTGSEGNVAVVQQFFAALEAMDIDQFMALWAEEARQEMPFAPKGFPTSLEGKEAIRRQYGGLPDAYSKMIFPNPVVRPLYDPGLVFAEYRGEIDVRATGRSYNNRYCGLFYLEDEHIKLFREYFNPIVLLAAFGDNLGQTFSLSEE